MTKVDLNDLTKLSIFWDRSRTINMPNYRFPNKLHCLSSFIFAILYDSHFYEFFSESIIEKIEKPFDVWPLINKMIKKFNNSHESKMDDIFWYFLDDTIGGLYDLVQKFESNNLSNFLTLGNFQNLIQFHLVDNLEENTLKNAISEKGSNLTILSQHPIFVLKYPFHGFVPIQIPIEFMNHTKIYFFLQSLIVYYNGDYHTVFVRGGQLILLSNSNVSSISVNDFTSFEILAASYSIITLDKGQNKSVGYYPIKFNQQSSLQSSSQTTNDLFVDYVIKITEKQFNSWMKDRDKITIHDFLCNLFEYPVFYIMMIEDVPFASINQQKQKILESLSNRNEFNLFKIWIFCASKILMSKTFPGEFEIFSFISNTPSKIKYCAEFTLIYLKCLLSEPDFSPNESFLKKLSNAIFTIFDKSVSSIFEGTKLMDDSIESFEPSKNNYEAMMKYLNVIMIDFEVHSCKLQFYQGYLSFMKRNNITEDDIKNIKAEFNSSFLDYRKTKSFDNY
ncbi:hypothetical protein TRFO_19643 [Tritrichomonas foetus]|uniref:Uncharacterized protein n=1 Tax=Tritrichomonas foetus TaxID=1144522 RepID=A0A1J4KNG9_9EUKA|nr:hypothetical protein TRFO_19643 [Tritrichomonas foetus]|eukprot:OHT10941.1 hypothetical protein TRFO_19643 [Tritrichomonas foetus]